MPANAGIHDFARKKDVDARHSPGMTGTDDYRPVMAGHSRSKNGVASLAYVPAIHVLPARKKDVDGRIRGHDEGRGRRFSPSWPGLSRPSTSLPHARKTWMPGIRRA
jgi:hypothetical protein